MEEGVKNGLVIILGSQTKASLGWNPQGKRFRRKPCGNRRRLREDDVIKRGMTWREVNKLAQDRQRWRGFVSFTYPELGCERL